MKWTSMISAGMVFSFSLSPFWEAHAWDLENGDWSKSEAADLRVMTWNIKDHICRTNNKVEGFNSWTAVARVVAAMKPDVLLLQEAGDNQGNGTGSGVDSVSQLETVIDLLFHGGPDPFLGGMVTSYVQAYAPDYDLPHVFVSPVTDGYNRNVIVSRFPFTDLNGDAKSEISDIPYVTHDLYAPGGNGGIRGFQFAEYDLPNDVYRGDGVVGNAHLKANDDSWPERLKAAQNVAYVIDYWFNGGGYGAPDPRGKISDYPPATLILQDETAVVIGGDWNEDELTNGRKGPADWLTQAEVADPGGTDGTDRDRSDMVYDDARNPVDSNDRFTYGTGSNKRKYDYIAWQDSIARLRRAAYIFNSAGMPTAWYPPEILGFPNPPMISGTASDHRPVIADVIVPRWCDGDGDGDVDLSDFAGFQTCLSGPGQALEFTTPTQACLDIFDVDTDADVDLPDFGAFQRVFTVPQQGVRRLLGAAFARWHVEMGLERAKQETGFGAFEVRTYPSLIRHGLCSRMAMYFLTVQTERLRGETSADHAGAGGRSGQRTGLGDLEPKLALAG